MENYFMNWLVKNTQEWFEIAQRDLQAAKLLREARLYENALFNCQQAAEKAVKGFLTYHDKVFDKDHNISKHLIQASGIESRFELWKEAAALLTKYAVLPRYPDDVLDVSAKSSATAYKFAKGIYDHALSVLPKGIMLAKKQKRKTAKSKKKVKQRT